MSAGPLTTQPTLRHQALPTLKCKLIMYSAGSHGFIHAWLATLQTNEVVAEQSHHDLPRKRRRIDSDLKSSLPLSPPPSQVASSAHATMELGTAMGTKRKHGADESHDRGEKEQCVESGRDLHATPRASQLNEGSIERITTPSLVSTTTASSRASSPTKQLRRLALEPDGFVHRMIAKSRTQLPESLVKLVAELEAVARGFRLLPHEMRAEVRIKLFYGYNVLILFRPYLRSAVPSLSRPEAYFSPFTFQLVGMNIPDEAFRAQGDPESTGVILRYPPRDLVAWLLDQAEECELNCHGEPSWNTELHVPMMEWVLRPNRQRRLVDYTYCTGAQIVKSYKPRQSPSNMVDFCMVIRPPQESLEAQRIDTVRLHRADVTINHTDHGILHKSPIAVSFETKRPGANLDKATVQMGTWHSSQWRSILKEGIKPLALEFLPGVIISGHTWRFVASTLENDRSVFYTHIELGNTSNEFGIITLLVVLQHLAAWAENVYWPAFKSDMLGL
ncbi:hypothetical protein E4U41_004830 [Claviceps citrina]|nr:hypothetical protein E4U41_004830 [Claviceps citrina]